MSYKITKGYCWYNEGTQIVLMYFLNSVPFTFDELPDGYLYDKDLCEEANNNPAFEPEDLYTSSSYLIEEEVHPCFFNVEIKNPEDLPEDLESYYN